MQATLCCLSLGGMKEQQKVGWDFECLINAAFPLPFCLAVEANWEEKEWVCFQAAQFPWDFELLISEHHYPNR